MSSELLDIYEQAFRIIANASGGDWTKESEEWQGAAARFRTDYYHALDKETWDTEKELLEQEVDELQRKLREARTVRQATPTESICFEIERERKRQDEKWGGPDHDDTHSAKDWALYRVKREQDILDHPRRYTYDCIYRKALIEIAALAVAQIESLDRETEGTL
jgi:hypothetical protein